MPSPIFRKKGIKGKMNQAQDFLDAIEVIVDKKLKSQSSQIYSGLVTAVSTGKCSMRINGKVYTNIIVYGNTPTVNSTFPVFVPQNNMSAAFIIVP